jgi:hypothetical protein
MHLCSFVITCSVSFAKITCILKSNHKSAVNGVSKETPKRLSSSRIIVQA